MPFAAAVQTSAAANRAARTAVPSSYVPASRSRRNMIMSSRKFPGITYSYRRHIVLMPPRVKPTDGHSRQPALKAHTLAHARASCTPGCQPRRAAPAFCYAACQDGARLSSCIQIRTPQRTHVLNACAQCMLSMHARSPQLGRTRFSGQQSNADPLYTHAVPSWSSQASPQNTAKTARPQPHTLYMHAPGVPPVDTRSAPNTQNTHIPWYEQIQGSMLSS